MLDAAGLRAAARAGDHTGPTAGLAPGYTQANLVALPEADAFDFLRFCVANPKPCPVLDVSDPGSPEPARIAPGADLRTDVPRYRIFRDGEIVDEPTDASEHWRDDLVAFLIGCSFTFERALEAEGLPIRHVEQGVNVPMYRTSRECEPAGRFSGPLVVSMRPMTPEQAIRATQITSRYGPVHGAPGPHRLAGGDRDRGHRRARLRRPGGDPRRRAAGVLGLRRDAPGGRGRLEAGADDHPRPGPHVRDRPARRDDGDALSEHRLRQQRADDPLARVDDLGDLQVHAQRAQQVGVLARERRDRR